MFLFKPKKPTVTFNVDFKIFNLFSDEFIQEIETLLKNRDTYDDSIFIETDELIKYLKNLKQTYLIPESFKSNFLDIFEKLSNVQNITYDTINEIYSKLMIDDDFTELIQQFDSIYKPVFDFYDMPIEKYTYVYPNNLRQGCYTALSYKKYFQGINCENIWYSPIKVINNVDSLDTKLIWFAFLMESVRKTEITVESFKNKSITPPDFFKYIAMFNRRLLNNIEPTITKSNSLFKKENKNPNKPNLYKELDDFLKTNNLL